MNTLTIICCASVWWAHKMQGNRFSLPAMVPDTISIPFMPT